MSLESFERRSRRRGRRPLYIKIHALYQRPKSGCEYFVVEEGEGYYLAYCKVLERYLTSDQALKCERLWQSCPFRRFGELMGVEEG